MATFELSDSEIDRIAKRSAHFVLQELAAKDGRRAHKGEIPDGLSVNEAARKLGVSTVSVRRMISTGELAAVKMRGRLVIPSSAVAAKLEIP